MRLMRDSTIVCAWLGRRAAWFTLSHPLAQFTLAAERERKRDGTSDVSVRAIGADVFAQRKQALLQASGVGTHRGSEATLFSRGNCQGTFSSLPRAIRFAIGAVRGEQSGTTSELSRRLNRLRISGEDAAPPRVGRLSGLRASCASGGACSAGNCGDGRRTLDDEALNILAARRQQIDDADAAHRAALAAASEALEPWQAVGTELPSRPSTHPEVCVGGHAADPIPLSSHPPPPSHDEAAMTSKTSRSIPTPPPPPLAPSTAPPPPIAPSSLAQQFRPSPIVGAAYVGGDCGEGAPAAAAGRVVQSGASGGFLHSAEFAAKLRARKQTVEDAERQMADALTSGRAAALGRPSCTVTKSEGMTYLDQLAERIAARANAKGARPT